MSPLPPALERLKGTVGIWTGSLDALTPRRAMEVAHELESLGYAALWLPEAWGREALTNSSLVLSATSRLVVATGIANIWGRDAVAAQNGLKTLSMFSDERFVLGLGVSHAPLVERLRGHEYTTPLASMRSYLEAMDHAPMHAFEASASAPRLLAALGPKMLELAASHADGAHPYLVTPEHTAQARAALGEKFLGVEQAVVLGHDRDEFLRRAHDHLELYTGLPNYTNNWRRLGFGDEDFVRGGSERLCDALVVHGDLEDVAESISQHRLAGADHVCLQVLGDAPGTTPLEEWRTLAALSSS